MFTQAVADPEKNWGEGTKSYILYIQLILVYYKITKYYKCSQCDWASRRSPDTYMLGSRYQPQYTQSVTSYGGNGFLGYRYTDDIFLPNYIYIELTFFVLNALY